MPSILEIATRIDTPLALGGFMAAAFFLILRAVVTRRRVGADVLILVINRLFVLSLVAMVLGVGTYCWLRILGSGGRRTEGPKMPCSTFQTGRNDEVACNGNTADGFYWSVDYKLEHYSTSGPREQGFQPPCNGASEGNLAMTARFPYEHKTFLPVHQRWSNPRGVEMTAPGCNTTPDGRYRGTAQAETCGIFLVTCRRQPG